MIALVRNLAKVFTVLLVGVPTAFADDAADIRAGNAALEAKDYQTAIHKFLPLAIEGNAEAQYRIARMYFHGHGVRKDYCASTIWVEKAARQKYAYAAIAMSFAYDGGFGVLENREMAYRWMVYADKMGHPSAAEDIEFMADGLKDFERATVDLDMETWDPSKLPVPQFFIIDESVLKPPSFSVEIAIRKGLRGCQ